MKVGHGIACINVGCKSGPFFLHHIFVDCSPFLFWEYSVGGLGEENDEALGMLLALIVLWEIDSI